MHFIHDLRILDLAVEDDIEAEGRALHAAMLAEARANMRTRPSTAHIFHGKVTSAA